MIGSCAETPSYKGRLMEPREDRVAEVNRVTKETQISLALNLDSFFLRLALESVSLTICLSRSLAMGLSVSKL